MNDLFEEYNAEYNKKVLREMYNHSLCLGSPLHYYNMLVDINGNKLGSLFYVNPDKHGFYGLDSRLARRYGTGAGNIYKIENTRMDKIYIGKSNDIYKRKSHHVSTLYGGSHENSCMQMDFYLFGMNSFIFEIIEKVEYRKDLVIREKFWIKEYNCEYPNGYNSTIGKGSRNDYSKRYSLEFVEKYKNSTPQERKILIGEVIENND